MRSRLLLLAVLGSACAPSPEWAEVAPVLESRCLGCHGSGGAWPPLHDPAVLSGLAPRIASEVSARTMPAWAPDDAARPLRDRLALPDDERRLLLRWLDDGANVPSDAELTPPERPTLDADLALDLPAHDVDGESLRCFLVELPDTRLTGFDVQASEIVHHALLGVHPASRRAALQALDEADPGPGWACPDAFMPDAALPPERVPVLWFPSPTPTTTFPGTGIPLGGVGVVQVHGLGAGIASGVLQLTTDDAVIDEISLPLGTGDVPLPDGEDTFTLERKGLLGRLLASQGHDLGDGPLRILGARGHGHHLLSRLTIDLDGEPILDLVRWDPRVQPRYLLETPVRAEPDQVVTLTCTYDTSEEARARAADYGEDHEMCGGWLFLGR